MFLCGLELLKSTIERGPLRVPIGPSSPNEWITVGRVVSIVVETCKDVFRAVISEVFPIAFADLKDLRDSEISPLADFFEFRVERHVLVWFGTPKVYHTESPLERDRVLCHETVTTQDRTQGDPSVKGRESPPFVVNNRLRLSVQYKPHFLPNLWGLR